MQVKHNKMLNKLRVVTRKRNPEEGFSVIFENKFASRRGIALSIFHTDFSANCDSYVWKNENLNCGFSSQAISFKCDQ